jgi:hypothetical protein
MIDREDELHLWGIVGSSKKQRLKARFAIQYLWYA